MPNVDHLIDALRRIQTALERALTSASDQWGPNADGSYEATFLAELDAARGTLARLRADAPTLDAVDKLRSAYVSYCNAGVMDTRHGAGLDSAIDKAEQRQAKAWEELERARCALRELCIALGDRADVEPEPLRVAPTAKESETPDESGYVESPTDPAAYAPAADIMAKHTPLERGVSMKDIKAITQDYTSNRVRWTRPLGKKGRAMRNRRSVHLGDWAAYLDRQTSPDSEGFPHLPETEIERRKAAIRDAKRARK